MKKHYQMRFTYFSFIILFFCCNVQNGKETNISSNGYNLADPVVITMPKELNEISGIALDTVTSSVIAINDEEGKIYSFSLTDHVINGSCNFNGKGDYEDIVFTGEEWYILKSDGNVYLIKNIFTDTVSSEKYQLPEKTGEFEGMFFDHNTHLLYLLCKDCKYDNNHKRVTIFAFNVKQHQWESASNIAIDVKKIESLLNEKKIEFKPSAIAIHPIDKQLYILSGVNNLLVEADMKGNALNVYKLSKKLFKQAEGICFAPNGDMYISNESAHTGPANILWFRYEK